MLRLTITDEQARRIEVEVPLPPGIEALVADPEQPAWIREDAQRLAQDAVRSALEQLGFELNGDPKVEVVTEPAPGQSAIRSLS